VASQFGRSAPPTPPFKGGKGALNTFAFGAKGKGSGKGDQRDLPQGKGSGGKPGKGNPNPNINPNANPASFQNSKGGGKGKGGKGGKAIQWNAFNKAAGQEGGTPSTDVWNWPASALEICKTMVNQGICDQSELDYYVDQFRDRFKDLQFMPGGNPWKDSPGACICTRTDGMQCSVDECWDLGAVTLTDALYGCCKGPAGSGSVNKHRRMFTVAKPKSDKSDWDSDFDISKGTHSTAGLPIITCPKGNSSHGKGNEKCYGSYVEVGMFLAQPLKVAWASRNAENIKEVCNKYKWPILAQAMFDNRVKNLPAFEAPNYDEISHMMMRPGHN
jgi:hypothetical protein